MAAKKERKEQVTAAETAIAKQLETLGAQIEKQKDGKATEAQAKQRTELKGKLARLRFERIANKRVPKLLNAIKGIGNLSGPGYNSTPDQQKAICKALKDAVDAAEKKLAGTKEAASGFVLPTTEAAS